MFDNAPLGGVLSRAFTVAFDGITARPIEVQCAIAPGLPGFSVVGLPDKAVSEARERVRTAFNTMGLAFPNKRITVNLSPADLPKVGSHFDLPIAMALLGAMDVIPIDEVEGTLSLGELSLDGQLLPVSGALPAAMTAADMDKTLLCPEASGPEAAWVEAAHVLAPATLAALVGHFSGRAPLTPAEAGAAVSTNGGHKNMRDVKGQARAKRALEIAAAGRHHMLMVGPPGAGKSMLASRIPSILPPLTPREALETSVIQSVAGELTGGQISRTAPYRAPHHTATKSALVGGGTRVGPGEISLAHNGVLFLDELPEFSGAVLETLRQPIETGEVRVARANAHVTYPARAMVVAAANPCRCGHLGDASRACAKAPRCGQDYLGRISGPLLDRFDIRIEVPALSFQALETTERAESSDVIAGRVASARAVQIARFADRPDTWLNSDAEGDVLDEIATPDEAGRALLEKVDARFNLTSRGYHRILRVARTIADLEGSPKVLEHHLAEAVSYRVTDLIAH